MFKQPVSVLYANINSLTAESARYESFLTVSSPTFFSLLKKSAGDVLESVTLFELQKPLYDLSVKSIKYNNLENKFTAVNCRVQDIDNSYAGKFSLITCNPPYMEKGRGFVDEKECIALCRAEIALTLDELVLAISKALKFGGRVNMVHRADRLADVICCFRAHNIEPKRLQLVSSADKKPYLFLIEGLKGGKSGLAVEASAVN